MVPALNLLAGRGYGVQENGFRTPTYPLFLAVLLARLDRTPFSECTDAHRAVCIGNGAKQPNGFFALRVFVVANIILGVATTVLLYLIGWNLTRSICVAFLFGAGYAWNISTAFWEISLLTESLTTFLITFVVFLTLRTRPNDRWTPFALGILLGALALCHQLYLAFWILPVAVLVVRHRKEGFRRIAKRVAPVLLIPLVLLGAWSTFNYVVNGFFTPSTLSGYVVSQIMAPALEHAPRAMKTLHQRTFAIATHRLNSPALMEARSIKRGATS